MTHSSESEEKPRAHVGSMRRVVTKPTRADDPDDAEFVEREVYHREPATEEEWAMLLSFIKIMVAIKRLGAFVAWTAIGVASLIAATMGIYEGFTGLLRWIKTHLV